MAQPTTDTKHSLAAVSHEIRSPLSVVLAWAQLGSSGRLPATGHAAAFERIEEAALNIKRHIDDLLQLAALDRDKHSLELEPLILGQVARQVIDNFAPLASERSVELGLTDDSEEGVVVADRVRLRQIFENLVGNALKHTPHGGRIELRLSASSDRLRCEVRDSGEGLEASQLEVIFEPFHQLTRKGARSEGLGLGLAITSRLVHALAGRVWAESAGRGQGSTFMVEFPRWIPPLQ